MTALSKDRNTVERPGNLLSIPAAENTEIFAGSLVVVDADGNAAPGYTDTGLTAAGRAEEYVNNNPGDAGAKNVTVKRGVFKFANDATDPVVAADLLSTCYIVDDQTVAATDGTETRSVAGKVLGIDVDGVWVEVG